MQKQQHYRSMTGAKAIALDKQTALVRMRFFQFLALILSAAFALGLHLIFGH
ncbi:hypothetical protein [Ktedonosporobacter rubrisoli]|uniref:hypothetical protein n=1 Tax=Ktedonosporobacter rubrisoli TaxID=2509675 RepID=UPI0013EE5178|nr:hypothetical protein [Ktedonosporobacter rubrisoli]